MHDYDNPQINVSFYQPEQPKGEWLASISFGPSLKVGVYSADTKEEAQRLAEEALPGIVEHFKLQQEHWEAQKKRREQRAKTWWGRVLNYFE